MSILTSELALELSSKLISKYDYFKDITGYDSHLSIFKKYSTPSFFKLKNDQYYFSTQYNQHQIKENDDNIYSHINGHYDSDNDDFRFMFYRLEFDRSGNFCNHIFEKYDVQDVLPQIDELAVFIKKYETKFDGFYIQFEFDINKKLTEIKLELRFLESVSYTTHSIVIYISNYTDHIKSKSDNFIFAKMCFLGFIFDDLDTTLGYKDWIDMFYGYRDNPKAFETVIDMIHC